jgi:hypothetical protein
MHFGRVGPATGDLEIWSASERGYSFVISNESSSGPGLHGKPGFVASWRPINFNRPAIRVGGSPFKTFAEAEHAFDAMLAPSRLGLDIPGQGDVGTSIRPGAASLRSRLRWPTGAGLSITLDDTALPDVDWGTPRGDHAPLWGPYRKTLQPDSEMLRGADGFGTT